VAVPALLDFSSSAPVCRVTLIPAAGSPRPALVTGVLLGGLPAEISPHRAEWLPVEVGREPAPGHWLAHNLGLTTTIGDIRLGEVVALPAGDPGYRRWGAARAEGTVVIEDQQDRHLGTVWRLLQDRYGPLPWGSVDLVVADHEWPRAVSFPGIVILADSLVRRKGAAARYLYLVHELVHQWLGNLLPAEPGRARELEATVDAVAWQLVEDALPRPISSAFDRLFDDYRASPVPDLAERGVRTVAARDALRAAGPAALGDLVLAAGRRVRDTGLRAVTAPEPQPRLTVASTFGDPTC
jgi:hypothetical protein